MYKERRKVAIAATVVFVAGAGALAFSDDARHAYIAVERSGRVAVTLGLCINEWVDRSSTTNSAALMQYLTATE